jgi:hypothetical protein
LFMRRFLLCRDKEHAAPFADTSHEMKEII